MVDSDSDEESVPDLSLPYSSLSNAIGQIVVQ